MTADIDHTPASQQAKDANVNETPVNPAKKRKRIFVLLCVLFVLGAGGGPVVADLPQLRDHG